MPAVTDIAVVGAAVALPGVTDLDELFTDLASGASHLTALTDEDVKASGIDQRVYNHDNYVGVGVPLDRAEFFDRDLFNMTRAEALWTDPQQRLLLTLTREALDCAAIDAATERVGVWTTTTTSSYLWGRVDADDLPSPAEVDYRSLLGNDRDFAATRIAYKLGLTGPAMSVQSACSSALVALHQAVLALAFGDAQVAVVAAASLKFPQQTGYVHQAGGILSRTGQSRPFDASADGTVQGSGGGVVVLRPLADAIEHGDDVLAVIAGSAVNNDGSKRMGFSAPSAAGQQDVVTQALRRAGTAPDDIGYIETHGTGTPIGDPIEFRALERVYGTDRTSPCFLGAAKANFGHLDVAAGMVGLLKTILSVRNGIVFTQPAFGEINPAIELSNSVFEIPRQNTEVPDLRWAAVSSFGMGGTNAHVIVRRADTPAASSTPHGPATVTLSARTNEALTDYRSRLARFLRAHDTIALHDVATTLAARRRSDARWVVTVASTEELINQLIDPATEGVAGTSEANAPRLPSPPGARRTWLPPSPASGESYLLPLINRFTKMSPTAPETDIEELFRAFVADELGADRVDATTDFFEAGGESVALVSIVGKLADATGFRVDLDALDGVTEVGAMATILADQAARSRTPSDDLLTFGSGRPHIYLYPPAGGTNFCYHAIHQHMPRHTLAAFRAVREVDSVESIAAECVATLAKGGGAVNGVVLGGYSFGGNVAVEMCRQLIDDHGVYPARVVLLDSFAPQAFAGARDNTQGVADHVDRIVAEMVAGDRSYGDVDKAPALAAFRAVWQANTRALAAYRPEHPIATPITLLRATTPLHERYAAALGIDVGQVDQWHRWTTGSVHTVDVPGDHYSIVTDAKNRAALAARMAAALADNQPGRHR